MRVHFGDWTLDSNTRELRRGEEAVHLSPKAFRLLEVLIEARPTALSKEHLFEMIWPDTFVSESNLASLIKEIRIALNDDARQSKMIRTVFGHGYAFSAEATVEDVAVRVQSIAVLPFANAGGGEWDYVSDGVAESLLNVIGKLRGVRVVPRSTSFRFRSPNIDIKEAARAMHVDALVTGRIDVRNEALTIQSELVTAGGDAQLWGDRFQGPMPELLRLQKRLESEITRRIAELAGVDASPHPTARNDEAWHLYLRGHHLLNRRDADGFRRSIEAFRAASELDPDFAMAHAALAEAHVSLGTREDFPATEIFPLARKAAERALAVDPSVAAAHSAMAGIQELYERDWNAAEASHRAAVSLDPQSSGAAQWFALHFARRGQHAEAKQWIDRAVQLEPLSPIINTNAALIAYLARDFPAAVERADKALELFPHYEAALVARGVALIQLDARRAVDQLEEAARLSGRHPYTLSNLASAYAGAGRMEDVRSVRDELLGMAVTRWLSPAQIAIAELAVGNRAAALAALEVAESQRSPWLSYAPGDPRLDILREERSFRSIIDAIGLGSRKI